MNLKRLLNDRIAAALEASLGEAAPAVVQSAARPEFGDYQANGVMGAAKRLKRNPREVAADVVARADLAGIAARCEIAGPGFLNVTLDDGFLATSLATSAPVEAAPEPETVVVDYSCPNLAKEMHVGHLRSTIIGDAMARVLEALGHTVIRQNHVGDWGTQFGMLLTFLDETGADSELLSDLETFYREAKKRFDADVDFADRSRRAVVGLQRGDPEIRRRWQRFIDISLSHCQEIYDRLGTTLRPEHVMAESAYNDDLDAVIADLDAAGLLEESQGARCVFLDEFKGKDGETLPLIVQKSDGGYLYATTDLAAVRYRARRLEADRVMYFTDARQALHFRQVFAVAGRAGFARDGMSLEHHPFGAMLGTDGKPFKTRAGEVVKLIQLLDEAEERALAEVTRRNPELPEAERREIARVIGIGAVKYADLSKNRTSDYVFDWDQMLSFDGNTAPYLLYAYSRIRSVFRRGEVDEDALTGDVLLAAPEEHTLAVTLLRLQETLESVAADGFPHLLCGYLYELAVQFMRFYEACPILTAEGDVRASRLLLCRRTAETLKTGLNLLGIETVERM
ncbi:MAG: arginine--tRNA ligase [Gammaproteobacteria bacterium]|nr:arginine--tRNA ligase [Gammaproteobacteria bacterium]